MDLLEYFIILLKKGQILLPVEVIKDKGVLLRLPHQRLPVAIDLVELLLFHGHLFLEILGEKNGLQVNPGPLAGQPLVQHVLGSLDFGFVFEDLLDYWLYVLILLHHGDQRGQIVQHFLDSIDFVQQLNISSFVDQQLDLHLLQLGDDLLFQILLQLVFFGGLINEDLNLIGVFGDPHSKQSLQCDGRLIDLQSKGAEQLLPVIGLFLEALFGQQLDQPNVPLKVLDGSEQFLGDLQGEGVLLLLEGLLQFFLNFYFDLFQLIFYLFGLKLA